MFQLINQFQKKDNPIQLFSFLKIPTGKSERNSISAFIPLIMLAIHREYAIHIRI